MTRTVYLNGEFIPLSEAHISPLDRGFLFGDGVYEVIPVYGGKVFRVTQHLERLEHSLNAIYLALADVGLTRDDWCDIFNTLIEKNGGGELSIYLQVTRGTYPERKHQLPTPCQPTIFAFTRPLEQHQTVTPITAITIEDIRWQYCHIKTTSLLPNLITQHQATLAGVDDVILVRDGLAQEAAAANVFMVKDGKLLTPTKQGFILGGITRDLIIELAAAHDIPCEEQNIPLNDLYRADEIWLTSSTCEIKPVIRLDQHTISNAEVGPVFHQMKQIFQAYKQKLIAGEVT